MKPVLFLLGLCLVPLVLAAPIIETGGTITLTSNENTTISVTFMTPNGNDGGGGGGGGGAGDTGDNPCFETPPSTSHIYDLLEQGKEYTLAATSNEFLIKKVTFTVQQDFADGATFTLTHVLHIACETVPTLGTDLIALGYERVDHVGISTEDLSEVTIEFQIDKDAIGDATPDQVKLFRYHLSNWESVPTRLVSQGTKTLSYLADSPGLSMFAIVVPAPSSASGDEETSQQPTTSGDSVTGDVTTGPGDEESTPSSSEQDSTTGERTTPRIVQTIPWFGLIIVLIVGGVLGGYYVVNNRRRVTKVNEAAADSPTEEHEPIIGIAEIPDEALDPVEQLRRYVDKELRQGYRRDAIAAQLRGSGWPENIITTVLDEFGREYLAERGMHPHDDYEKAQAFIREKLELGYDLTAIRKSLVKVGWDATLLDSLMNDLQSERASETALYSEEALDKLRAFIKAELDSGHTRERVKASLLAAGWQERAVNEELQRNR